MDSKKEYVDKQRVGTLKFALLLFLLLSIVITLRFTNLGSLLQPERIRSFIQSFGFWSPLAYILIYSLVPSLFIPRFVLSITGGLLFGSLYGTIYTLIGANFSASIGFYITRFFGRDFIARVVKGRLLTLDEKAAEHGFKVILLLRLTPVAAFNLVNFGAGLSKIRFRDYITATFFGIIPGTFAYVYLGSSLTDIYSRQFLYALLFLLLLTLAYLFFRRFKKVLLKTPEADKKGSYSSK